MDDVTLEGVLYALSDPIRLQIVKLLAESSCGRKCSSFKDLASAPLAKSTLSQHFRILRESGVIWSERNGVELSNTIRGEELRDKFGPLLETILSAATPRAPSKRRKKA